MYVYTTPCPTTSYSVQATLPLVLLTLLALPALPACPLSSPAAV